MKILILSVLSLVLLTTTGYGAPTSTKGKSDVRSEEITDPVRAQFLLIMEKVLSAEDAVKADPPSIPNLKSKTDKDLTESKRKIDNLNDRYDELYTYYLANKTRLPEKYLAVGEDIPRRREKSKIIAIAISKMMKERSAK
ncbi:MAG: hypothetical protein V4736_14975 [Bdellovibrionota bacterium]